MNEPSSFVVVSTVWPLTVTLTGRLAIGLPSSSRTLPVMFTLSVGVAFSGTSTLILASTLTISTMAES